MNFLKILGIVLLITKNIYSQETVESIKNIINTGIEDCLKYKAPTDARRYKPTDTTIKDYGSYDFVIIGGGATGSVLASRLSEIKNFTVLVLEAGEFANNNSIFQIPLYAQTGWLSDYNWGFKSIPQTTACLGTINNQCQHPRGRGVGGATLINGIVYDRGPPENYNIYARLVKDDSWSYRKILKYFKKTENFHWTNPKAPVDIEYHGKHGLLDVQQQIPDIRLNDLYLQAHRELGVPITDYNGPNRLGGTLAQIYTRKGRRLDFGTAFVKPFLNRDNLKVLTGSYVTKIVFNDKKEAERVVFTKDGNTYSVKANKEIILSAGTVSSPQILMLSGIGPKKHLQQHGIKVLEDLEVGTRFLDPAGTKNFIFSTNYSASSQTLTEEIHDFLKGTGTLTAGTVSQGISFLRVLVPNKGMSDLEIIFDIASPGEIDKRSNNWKNETYQEIWRNNKLAVSFFLRSLYTKSVGTIRLKSSDPFDYPLIDPRYLSDPNNEDIETLYRGIQFVFKLAGTPAFKKLNMTYTTEPLSACKNHKFKSKDYWYCFIRQLTLTATHPVGTCSMGTDRYKGAVVDSELKVYGVKGLRVVDASVFPEPLAGHTSIPCSMLGEKMSEVIIKKYGKHSRHLK